MTISWTFFYVTSLSFGLIYLLIFSIDVFLHSFIGLVGSLRIDLFLFYPVLSFKIQD